MNSEPAIIVGVGWVDGSTAAPDQRGLNWPDFSDQPFDRFERLDLLSQYAAAAVARAGVKPIDDPEAAQRIGVVLATSHGSLDIDARFIRSIPAPGGPSPLLFPYTLPSAPLAAITIHHHITGPALCVMPAESALKTAMWEALLLLNEGNVDRIICVIAEAATAATGPGFDSMRGTVGEPACYAIALDLASSQSISTAPPLGPQAITLAISSCQPDCNKIDLAGSAQAELEFARMLGPDQGRQFPLWIDGPWQSCHMGIILRRTKETVLRV